MKRPLHYISTGFGVIVIVLCLALPAQAARSSENKELYEELDILAKALHFVREHYVDDVDDEELVYGAIRGMMETLDPHSVFMTPDIYRELQLDTRGRFGGVGIEVSVRDHYLTVIAPIEGSPAHRAGIQAGDKIVAIDGKSTKNMSLAEAVKLMRGRRGTKVQLSIQRNGRRNPLHVTVRRDIIRIQSVRSVEDLGGGLAYMRISSFQQDTSAALEKALRELQDNGEKGLRGLLVDLRNNPGGLLQEAVAVTDRFLEEGVIVSTKSRIEPVREQKAHKEGTYPEFPIVLLVNGGSASAAEIFAGALQDHNRALVVGTPTFGKGSVQTVYELERGAALKLTMARYYTPSGRSIQDAGIQPDIIVEVPKEETKDGESPETAVEVEMDVEDLEDIQKEKAISYLRQWAETGKKPKAQKRKSRK